MKRVITLQEPWASLIGEGIKTIETRSWPCNQFGEIYIHAGMSKIPAGSVKKFVSLEENDSFLVRITI